MYLASNLAMHSAAEHIIVHSVASMFDKQLHAIKKKTQIKREPKAGLWLMHVKPD